MPRPACVEHGPSLTTTEFCAVCGLPLLDPVDMAQVQPPPEKS